LQTRWRASLLTLGSARLAPKTHAFFRSTDSRFPWSIGSMALSCESSPLRRSGAGRAIGPGALERLSLSATSAGTMPANMAADTVVLRRTGALFAALYLA
jgi:hypothetical protein